MASAHTPSARRRFRTAALLSILALALPAVLVAAAPAPREGGRDDGLAPVQRAADAIVDFGVTGVQVRVTDADGATRTVTSGVADVTTGEPVSPVGYLRAGSVTKTFVSAVVLQLVAEGRLTLEDPVERWLPDLLAGPDFDGRAITIRQLLQHTSGLEDYDDPELGSEEYYREHRDDVADPAETVAATVANGPLFPPGTGWAYSNTGYVVVGMVIEEVTGHHWAKEVHDRLIRPLGLADTYWPGYAPTLPDPHATGYQVFEPGGSLVDVTRLVLPEASGSLISTTADLERFLRALFGGEVLDAPQLREMLRTVPVAGEGYEEAWPGGAEYGLGVFRVGFTSCPGHYWHSGGDVEGAMTRTGITDSGRRSVSAFLSTQVRDSMESLVEQNHRANALLESALCGGD
ncbi:D-alanyl-D-alanine carboxypeptidase [Streptomyces zhaozhouensis]|uniref:D-alanyl-D-alanine carboxypeptidase n=1 Tax=Streptomyces zhaozhouensis TaxID=1300267 RepID=A0A286E068_9ACTN|nr:serine hydrolase domain-containing protein [Streptomyces zhaozhouensis]SOD64311.1 D-alanyl-D-alanine carboxypeptidase [Streptomyces zhaozhouensis]